MSELSPELIALSTRADAVLERALPDAAQPPHDLHAAMRYAVLGGGKRMRPLLAYASGAIFSPSPDAVDAPAAAVEIIHAYSLVHDDLPAMDDDALRRGRPTCHIVYGEAMAILAGDALQALAFEVLAQGTATIDAPTRVDMLCLLAAACGSHGMAGGQAFDLSAVGTRLDAEELERMHVHKTGALIRASVRLGALAAGARDKGDLDTLERYAHCVGLAFQIRDDILDIEGEATRIGKTPGKDVANAKPTYPAILGLDASRAALESLTREALDCLDRFGDAAVHLRDLAHFIALRES